MIEYASCRKMLCLAHRDCTSTSALNTASAAPNIWQSMRSMAKEVGMAGRRQSSTCLKCYKYAAGE